MISDQGLLTRECVAVVAAATALHPHVLAGHVEVRSIEHRADGVAAVYRVAHAGAVDHLVVTTEPAREPEAGVVVVDVGSRTLRTWWRRDDPALPGLRAALDPARVRGWLPDAKSPGSAGSLDRDGPVSLELLSYRPGRRAVVSAHTESQQAYLKVVPPARAQALIERHAMIAAAPAVLGHPEPGVVILAPAHGESLALALANGADNLPSPGAVVGFLMDLPTGLLDLPARPPWPVRLAAYAGSAAAEVGLGSDVELLRHMLQEAIQPDALEVPTHGDLNVANLFVETGRSKKSAVVAVIDVDDAGPGELVDDLATLLAHLHVLPDLAPQQYGHLPALIRPWRAEIADHADAEALDARTAAMVLSLVAGAGPLSPRRLALAKGLVSGIRP